MRIHQEIIIPLEAVCFFKQKWRVWIQKYFLTQGRGDKEEGAGLEG